MEIDGNDAISAAGVVAANAEARTSDDSMDTEDNNAGEAAGNSDRGAEKRQADKKKHDIATKKSALLTTQKQKVREASDHAAVAMNTSSKIGEDHNGTQINFIDTQTSDPSDKSIVIKISFRIDLENNPEFINTNATKNDKRQNPNHPVTSKLSTFLHLLEKHHPSISFRTSGSDLPCTAKFFWQNGNYQSDNHFREHMVYMCCPLRSGSNFETIMTVLLSDEVRTFGRLKYHSALFPLIQESNVFIDRHTGARTQIEHNYVVWQLNKDPYAVHLAKSEAETNVAIWKYCWDNSAVVKGLHQKYTLEQDWDGTKIPKVMLAVKDIFSGRRGAVI